MVDGGLNRENQETMTRIRRSRKAEVDIEFLMGYNCIESQVQIQLGANIEIINWRNKSDFTF